MVTCLSGPLTAGIWLTLFQEVAGPRRAVASCRSKPVEGLGQEITALVPTRRMRRVGMAELAFPRKLQNPPVTPKPVAASGGPASGWPIVPETANPPPLIAPPPPSMVDHVME